METFHDLISSEDTGKQIKENEIGGAGSIHRIRFEIFIYIYTNIYI